MSDTPTDALDGKSMLAPAATFAPFASTKIYASRLKRAFDLIGAGVLIVFCAPLMMVVALLIKLDGGPVFYGHTRVGYQHRAFPCWKFRTMVVNADKTLADLLQEDPEAREIWQRNFKLPNDPRVSGISRILRMSSIDELPQLWNVIRGDMSLVGPRPVTQNELALYGAHVDEFLSCRPGITGLWQVSGRSKLSYEERVSLDLRYIRDWSLGLDVKITLKTLTAVLSRRGAC